MKQPRFLVALTLLSFFCLGAHAANNRALLIGISQYAELEGLRYADADVKTFQQILTDIAGYRRQDVTLLLNTEATRQRIINEIFKLVAQSKREPLDHLFFV